MPPIAKKDLTIILFDLKMKNRIAAEAKLKQILMMQMYSGTQHLCVLFLTNCEKTKNELNDNAGETGYENIFKVHNVTKFDINLLNFFDENQCEIRVDWTNPIMVATDEAMTLQKVTSYGITTKRILYFTDLEGDVSQEVKTTATVVEALKAAESFLYVVGPDVEVAKYFKFPESDKFNLCSTKNLSEHARNNVGKLLEVLRQTDGLICALDIAAEFYLFYKSFIPPQAQGEDLIITETLKLNVLARTYIKSYSNIKKHWRRSPSTYRYVKKIPEEDGSLKEVEHANVVDGVFVHGKFIPFTEDIKSSFKGSEKVFRVLCFVDAESVHEYFLRDDKTSVLIPKAPNDQLYAAFLEVLIQQKKYAIALRNYRANFEPKLTALIPHEKPKVLLMVEVPFKNDVLKKIEPGQYQSLNKINDVEKNTELEEALDEYFSSIDIEGFKYIDKIPVKFSPILRLNPSNLVVYRKLNAAFLKQPMLEQFSQITPEMLYDLNCGEVYANTIAKVKEVLQMQSASGSGNGDQANKGEPSNNKDETSDNKGETSNNKDETTNNRDEASSNGGIDPAIIIDDPLNIDSSNGERDSAYGDGVLED